MRLPNDRGKEVHRFGKKNPLVGTVGVKNREVPERTIAAKILQRCISESLWTIWSWLEPNFIPYQKMVSTFWIKTQKQ